MVNIQYYLDKIKNAILGVDVRNSIHDAIKQCYIDASKQDNANMEVSLARGTFETLNHRLEDVDSQLVNFDGKVEDAMKRVESKADIKTVVSNLYNTEGIVTQILDICQTYTDNFDKLAYGNAYTAWDNEVKTVNGRYQLDCSSFISLLIHGVTFYSSRYNGRADNQGSPLFFQGIDSYQYRYANEIAKFGVENGYAFEPNADFSNIRAGDLVFFRWNELEGAGDEFHENAFMRIDHVAMYLDRKNETYHQTIQYEQNTPQFLFNVSNEYMEQCVLVVRIPFAHVNDRDTKNLIVNGNAVKVCEDAMEVGTYYLNKKLVKGKIYSLTINGKVDTENSYFVLHDMQGNTLCSDYGRTNGSYKTTTSYFLYQGNGTDVVKILIGSSNTELTKRNGNIKWCVLNEGYKIINNFHVPSSPANVRGLEFNETVSAHLDADYTPKFRICEYDDHFIVNMNLDTTEGHNETSLVIGNLGFTISETTNIPCSFLSADNQSFNGYLQFKYDGDIIIKTLNDEIPWCHAAACGMVIK